jgi:hypothetical protein
MFVAILATISALLMQYAHIFGVDWQLMLMAFRDASQGFDFVHISTLIESL